MATATPAKPAPQKRRGSRYSNLFFFRRRPHLRGIPPDWDRPASDEAYQKMIEDESFISSTSTSEGDVSKHPIILRDLKDLEQYLLPTYFQFSQKSKYFQNQFYLYQWVFVWGAFLTTVFGALSTLSWLPASDAATTAAATATAVATATAAGAGAATAAAATTVSTLDTHQIFSIMTAIIGAATAFTTALSNRGEPQKRWAKTRRLSEELRMHYFTYLSHLPPYDQPNRVQKMRENVINIRVKEQENV